MRAKRKLWWRNGSVYRVMRRVLAHYLGGAEFRIVHISIQDDHLHMLVEAANKSALTFGMQSFAIRAARALNRKEGGCGKVFAQRYHATQVTTTRQARSCLAYVLNNWRKHMQDWSNGKQRREQLDEYSSAVSFQGWTKKFVVPAGHEPLPVSAATTWLLKSGWARHGAIDPFECPGPGWFD